MLSLLWPWIYTKTAKLFFLQGNRNSWFSNMNNLIIIYVMRSYSEMQYFYVFYWQNTMKTKGRLISSKSPIYLKREENASLASFNSLSLQAPCIVFIDEIDAVGSTRKQWEGHTKKTLHQLLVEMDGFEQNEVLLEITWLNRALLLRTLSDSCFQLIFYLTGNNCDGCNKLARYSWSCTHKTW